MKSALTTLTTLVVLAAVVSAIAAPALAATFQGLGYLPNGTAASFASAISADGQVVVGSSWTAPGSIESQPFRWTASGGMATVGQMSGWAGRASAVSYDGSVIVGTIGGQLFRWTAAEGVTDLDGLPGSFSGEAFGMSGDGSVVVGYSESVQRREAFIWAADKGTSEFEELSDLTQQSEAYDVSADGRTVVGWRSTENGIQAFRWTASGGIMGMTGMSEAHGTSGDGSVIVGQNAGEAVRWTALDGTTSIQVSGNPFSVSADGSVVVGEGLFGAGCYEAFVWTESMGALSLNDKLASVMPSGWFLYRATDVAVNGDLVTVVGHGTNPSGKDEAWIATFAVPEPSSALVLALALFGLGNVPMVRRFRTNQKPRVSLPGNLRIITSGNLLPPTDLQKHTARAIIQLLWLKRPITKLGSPGWTIIELFWLKQNSPTTPVKGLAESSDDRLSRLGRYNRCSEKKGQGCPCHFDCGFACECARASELARPRVGVTPYQRVYIWRICVI